MRLSLFDDGAADHDHPDHVRLAGVRLGATFKAVHVNLGTDTAWIPKSLIPRDVLAAFPERDGESCEVSVPEWFAKKEGLI